ncbi:MAG: polymer-forming cytoskeletal protein [Cyanobacteria bacterium J06598_1]
MFLFWRRQKRTASAIGLGCQFEGTLQTEGHLQIDGAVRGLVAANGDIDISETGAVEGPEIRGHNITIYGIVKAHVYAEGKLTLGETARIDGNAIAGIIEVSPGAYYTGHLTTYDSRTPFYSEAPAKKLPDTNKPLVPAAESKRAPIAIGPSTPKPSTPKPTTPKPASSEHASAAQVVSTRA